jgi:hypothetical protein
MSTIYSDTMKPIPGSGRRENSRRGISHRGHAVCRPDMIVRRRYQQSGARRAQSDQIVHFQPFQNTGDDILAATIGAGHEGIAQKSDASAGDHTGNTWVESSGKQGGAASRGMPKHKDLVVARSIRRIAGVKPVDDSADIRCPLADQSSTQKKRVIRGIDAWIGGSFWQLQFTPFAETALFDDNRQPAARCCLKSKIGAPSKSLVVSGQTHIAPRQVSAGIGPVQTDHDAARQGAISPGDDMNRDIARWRHPQIMGGTVVAARHGHRSLMHFLGDRGHMVISGQCGELRARLMLPFADVGATNCGIGELRLSLAHFGPVTLTRAEEKASPDRRIGNLWPAKQRHHAPPRRHDPGFPSGPAQTVTISVGHFRGEYREPGMIDSVKEAYSLDGNHGAQRFDGESESQEAQAETVALFATLDHSNTCDYAIRHQAIIERFARFPYRNDVLGRQTTNEERAFLEQPHSSF